MHTKSKKRLKIMINIKRKVSSNDLAFHNLRKKNRIDNILNTTPTINFNFTHLNRFCPEKGGITPL